MNNKKWSKFLIGNILNPKSTNSGIDKNKLTNFIGKIPYITRSNINNGYNLFIGIQDDKYKYESSNVITIGLDTQTVFYQKYKFYTGQNIQILEFNNINIYSSHFIIPLLKIQMEKFNWGGNGATLGRLNKTSLMLPIKSDNSPDYKYMEEYSKSIFIKKEKEYLNYIQKRYIELGNISKPIPLEEKKWKTFKVIEIFQKIQRGKRLKKSDHLQGTTPYASSTSLNNGIDGFVGNKTNVRIFKNCLTLANSGSVGCTFYQPFNIVASDHVTMLQNNTLNKYIYLFLSSMLSRLNEKYSFNREINDTRLSKEKILLPTRSDDSPDYEYMEQYMKYLEYQKLKEYLEYKKECK